MKKIISLWPFLLFILLLDRLFFLPGRMNGTWQYDDGTFIATQVTFSDIEIKK